MRMFPNMSPRSILDCNSRWSHFEQHISKRTSMIIESPANILGFHRLFVLIYDMIYGIMLNCIICIELIHLSWIPLCFFDVFAVPLCLNPPIAYATNVMFLALQYPGFLACFECFWRFPGSRRSPSWGPFHWHLLQRAHRQRAHRHRALYYQ